MSETPGEIIFELWRRSSRLSNHSALQDEDGIVSFHNPMNVSSIGWKRLTRCSNPELVTSSQGLATEGFEDEINRVNGRCFRIEYALLYISSSLGKVSEKVLLTVPL
jgi:hypothetical protein